MNLSLRASSPASRERLTDPDLLRESYEEVHRTSTNIALLGLLPAIQVAWADGKVHPRERAQVLAIAQREGLDRDPEAMERLVAWLETPPAEALVHQMLEELRTVSGAPNAQEVLDWARAVARADGGFLGFRTVSRREKETLAWLEAALIGGAAARRLVAESPKGRLGVLRSLLVERLAATDQHVDWVPQDVADMWPRPCPKSPERMPPAVFAIPQADYREFMAEVVARYIRTLTQGTPRALAVATEPAKPLDDDGLARMVWQTCFSRLLVPTLDPVDREVFADVLPRAMAMGEVYKIDHSHLARQTPLPGVQLAPSVGLFVIAGGTLKPVAIAMGGRAFEPRHGESWARARAFFLQGCSLSLVAGIHASLHFPGDSVIAVTREVLPVDHPVARLVEAHAYLQLPLNYGVRWNARSVAWNDQREVYTPFPTSGEGTFEGFADHYVGIEGNSGYPGWRYPMSAPTFPGPYGDFLRAYYAVFLAFCRRVAAHVSPSDAAMARWGAALHELLPGFPSPTELEDPEVLARALTTFVHGASVWHSVEHHVFAELPVRHVPQRLRVDPPTGDDPPVPFGEWMTPTDVFRQEMARQMFYEARPVRTLLEVRYGFAEAELAAAADALFDALQRCDRSLPQRLLPLERIACSIQF